MEATDSPAYKQLEQEFTQMEQHYLGMIAELKEERDMLLEQIEGEIDRQSQPIILPAEVAKAIDYLHNTGMEDFTILRYITDGNNSWRLLDGEISRMLSILDSFTESVELQQLFLAALVNGWKVDQPETIEQRIKAGVLQIYREWDPSDLIGISERIARFVKTEFLDTE